MAIEKINKNKNTNNKRKGRHVQKKHRKKIEFSKFLVGWALAFTTICVCISYFLSLFERDGLQEVTVAVITTCIAIAVAYEAKSYGEKNSRNKYGVDQDGNKIFKDDIEDNEFDEQM